MVKLFSSSLVVLLPNGQNFQSCFFGTEGKVRRRRRLGRTGLLGVFISFASFSAENFQVVLIFDLFFPNRKLEKKSAVLKGRQTAFTFALCNFFEGKTKISKANVLKGALMRNLAI